MSANGFLLDSELAYVDNGQRLRKDVAPRYLAMLAGALRDGVLIRTTEGYRDYATQVYLRNGWLAGLPGFNNASVAGYSPHGWGLASDLNTSGFGGTVYNWLVAHAADYGFDNAVGYSIDEHWHWVYNGGGTLGFSDAATDEEDEDKMYRFQGFGRGFMLAPGKILVNARSDESKMIEGGALNRVFGPLVKNFGGDELFWTDAQGIPSAAYNHTAAIEMSKWLQLFGIPGDFSTWAKLKVGQLYQVPVPVTVDQKAISDAVAAAMKTVTVGGVTDADIDEIATRAAEELAPKFAAIPDAVVDEFGRDAARLKD